MAETGSVSAEQQHSTHLDLGTQPVQVQDDKDLLQQFSPKMREKFQMLVQDVESGLATLELDAGGHVTIRHKNKRLPYVDTSQANLIASPRTDKDLKLRMEACLEAIGRIKDERAPSGVLLDKTKVSPRAGKYQENLEFTKLKEVLGSGNCSGDVVVVKDKATNSEHAIKTVMISEFRENELRAWVDLSESECIPSLYLFQLKDNKIEFHMEILRNVVSLRDIIDTRMSQIQKEDPNLLRPFSLLVLQGVLSAVDAMHNKNWAHRDLHAGNVLVQKTDDQLEFRILDFGLADPIKRPSELTNYKGVENDINQVIRLFSAVYTGEEFDDQYDLKNNLNKKLEEASSSMSREEREEMFELILMAQEITDVTKQNFHNKQPLLEKLEAKLPAEKKEDVLKRVASILFSKELHARAEIGTKNDADSEHAGEDTVDSVDSGPRHLDSFIEEFRLRTKITPRSV